MSVITIILVFLLAINVIQASAICKLTVQIDNMNEDIIHIRQYAKDIAEEH